MALKDASEFNALWQIQTDIAKQVVLEDPASEVASTGAVAQSFDDNLVFSSAVVVDTLMNVIDESASITKTAMPYVPGLLFFREGPAVIATVEKLRGRPDVLIVHGCGINHPRFAGLASHVGVILNTSTVGVSKKVLCGKYVEPAQAGRPAALTFNGKPLGFVLKPVAGTKPIFISPGNRISLQGALRIVQHCVVNHRLPEPLRLAHIKARHLRSVMRSGEWASTGRRRGEMTHTQTDSGWTSTWEGLIRPERKERPLIAREVHMRAYLYRCRVCGAEIWTDFIELDKLICESCHTAGKWLVLDVKIREKI